MEGRAVVFWLLLVAVGTTEMPGPQTQFFLEEFLRGSESGVRGTLPLPDVSYSARDTTILPLELILEARNGLGEGPTDLIDTRRVRGDILDTGSAHLEAYINLGMLQTFYNSTKLSFLGFEYEGPLGWRLENAVSRLVVEVKTSIFKKCKISLTLDPPEGMFFLLPGDGTGQFLAYLAEFGIAWKRNFTYHKVQEIFGDWALFLPLRDRLQVSLENTANKMFCKYKGIKSFK